MLPSPLLSGMNDVYENNPSSFSQDVVVSTAGKKSHHAEKNERKEASITTEFIFLSSHVNDARKH